MEDGSEYERAALPLVAEVREHLLLALAEIRSAGPGPHADYELAALERLRRTLAAVEQRLETIAAARLAGRDEAWEHAFRRGHAAGLRDRDGARRQVIPLRQPRAITA